MSSGQIFVPHGTTLTFASAGVGGLLSVKLPDVSKGQAQTTHHGSAGVRRYLPGLYEGGQITVTCRRIPGDAGQDALRDNIQPGGQVEQVVITFPAEATSDSQLVTHTFDGFVVAVDGDDLKGDADEAAEFSATIKVDGLVTEAIT